MSRAKSTTSRKPRRSKSADELEAARLRRRNARLEAVARLPADDDAALLDTDAACGMLGKSRMTLWNWCKQAGIEPDRRINGRRFYKASTLRRLIAAVAEQQTP